MKKITNINRFIALIMVAVMMITLVIIDNRVGLRASENESKTISIEELLPEGISSSPDEDGNISVSDEEKAIYFAAEGNSVSFSGNYFIKTFTGNKALATAGDADSDLVSADSYEAITVEADGSYEVAVYTKSGSIYTFYGIIRIVCDSDSPEITNVNLLNGGEVLYKETEDFYLVKANKSAKFEIKVSDGTAANASGIGRVVYKTSDSDSEIEVEKEAGKYIVTFDSTGSYTFTAYDKAGNCSGEKTVNVKTTPGIQVEEVTTTGVSSIVDENTRFLAGKTKFNITVKASENVSGYDISYKLRYKYTLKAGLEPLTGEQPFADGKATITIPAIPKDDTNRLVMWVEDEVGNTSYAFDENGYIVFVDNEKPTVTIKNIKLTTGYTYTYEEYKMLEEKKKWTKSIQFDVTAKAAASYIKYVEYTYPGADGDVTGKFDNNEDIGRYSYTKTGLVFGENGTELPGEINDISFKTKNYVNEESDVTGITAYIDLEAPELKLYSESKSAYVEDEEEEYVVGDAAGETIRVVADDEKSGLSNENIVATIQEKGDGLPTTVSLDENLCYTVNEPGYYTFTVTATDNAGNSITKDTKFVVDNIDPVITLEAVATYADGTTDTIDTTDDLTYTGGENIVVTSTVTGFDLDADSDLEINADYEGTAIDMTVSTQPVSGSRYMKKITATYTINSAVENQGKYNFVINAKRHTQTEFDENTGKQLVFIYDIESPGSIHIDFHGYEKKVGGIYYYIERPVISVSAQDNYNIISYKICDADNTLIASGTISGGEDGEIEDENIILDGSNIENNKKYDISFSLGDKAGNESAYIAAGSFVIDTGRPQVEIANVDADDKLTTYWNKQDVTLNVTGRDNFVVTSFKAVVTRNGEVVAEQVKEVSSPSAEVDMNFKYTREGVYEVKVYAIDAVGNTSTADKCTFVIDKKAPVPYIEGIPDNRLSKGTSVEFTVEDEYGLEAENVTIVKHYTTYSGVTGQKALKAEKVDDLTVYADSVCEEISGKAAKYWFTYTFTDNAGNTCTDKTKTFYVDNTEPDVTIKPIPSKTNNGYYNKAVKFDVNVVEQFDLVHNISIKDKNGNVPDIEKNFKSAVYSYTVKNSTQGVYNLDIVVTDAFGNYTKKNVRYVIDKEKPVITIRDVDKTSNGNVNLGIDISDKYKGDTYNVHVIRRNEAGDIAYEGDIKKGTWAGTEVHQDITFSEEGDYTVTVTAKDKAGNKAEQKETNFRIDKTAPVLSITGVNDIQNTGVTAVMSVDESFSFTYPQTSDNATISVTITKKTDGSAETSIATLSEGDFSGGNPHTASYAFNEDGEYTITMNATDACGNAATAVTKTFKVDQTSPVLTVSAVDKDNKKVESYESVGSSDAEIPNYVDVNVRVEEVFFNTNNVTFTVLKDGKDTSSQYFTNYANRAQISTGSQRFDEDGVYNINIKSKDELGNAAEEYGIVFTVDNTPPSIEATEKLTALLAKKTAGNNEILLNAEDFADITDKGYEALWTVNDTSVFTVDVQMDGVDFVDFSDLTDGQHTLEISVTDEVGHVSHDKFEFTYDGTAPRIIIQGAEDGATLHEPFTLKISLEDAEDIITKISINGQVVDPSEYEGTMAYEMNISEYDDYEILVEASDLSGNVTSTYDEATGKVFSFSLKEKISPVILIIIILAILLLLSILVIVIVRSKKKDKR
ncbi:MAG: Ig-like domain-containing protein [Coprococcus sp.]